MGLKEFLNKWIVLLCAMCDGIIIGFGIILAILALYYRSTMGGSQGPTESLIMISLLFICLGVVGGIALWQHWWWLVLAANAGTCFMFIMLMCFTVVAFIIGFDIDDPVKEGVIEGWPEARKEYEHAGLCAPLDYCTSFYPALDIKMAEWQNVANPNTHMQVCQALTQFDLATNCTHSKNCDWDLGTDRDYGCQKCDDVCMKQAIEDARDAMAPLAYTCYFAFFFMTLVTLYNDFLVERANFGFAGGFGDGEKDKLEWIGFFVNILIAVFSFVLVIMGGVFANSGSWTGIAILLLGLCLMGATITIAVALFIQTAKITELMIFIGNAALGVLSLVLLCVGVVAGLSAGIVTNINEEIENEWDTIREEIHRTDPNYCAYMDDDQCKKKIRDSIEANFYHVGIVCLFVLLFLVGKIFLTHKTTKFFFIYDKDEHSEMHN